ncbi:hypothetical protein [uncultured Gammaproteobacteria bacterium]|nr:hypothetical protein [thiotrophic endosymbiont of Bathymodiolus puteoserpentis (Logatchev)]CAC9569661.1 hypothetical protein [uncultured Gammaproteobacteria bacterium]
MTQSFIADNIGVNKSNISRELARNTGKRSYRYKLRTNVATNTFCKTKKKTAIHLRRTHKKCKKQLRQG